MISQFIAQRFLNIKSTLKRKRASAPGQKMMMDGEKMMKKQPCLVSYKHRGAGRTDRALLRGDPCS
jgi:hypothetical protein